MDTIGSQVDISVRAVHKPVKVENVYRKLGNRDRMGPCREQYFPR
ncbi:hypothetical protein ACIQJX_29790 [Streptomyces griseoviridis]